MDWLTFFSNIITAATNILIAFAWPGIVIAAMFLFKEELKKLLSIPLERIKWGDAEIAWQKATDRTLEEAEIKLESSPTTRQIEVHDTFPVTVDERLRKQYPPAIMLQSWFLLEDAVRGLAERHGLPKSKISPTWALADELWDKGIMDEESHAIFKSLRDLRNQVVHVRPDSVTPSQAKKYDSLVQRLIAKMNKQRNSPEELTKEER